MFYNTTTGTFHCVNCPQASEFVHFNNLCLQHLQKLSFYSVKTFTFHCSQCPQAPEYYPYNPLCLIHIQYATYFNNRTCTYHCNYCIMTSDYLPYDNDANRNIIKEKLYKCLKEAKTSAIVSTAIKSICNQSIDKSFLYVIRAINDTKNANITKNSSCLICMKKFSLGIHYPIQLHKEEKHEICYECYQQYKLNTCIIDHEPLNPANVIPASSPNLFTIDGNACTKHKTVLKFSYYNKIMPYLICCPKENICQECLQSNHEVSVIIICSNCNMNKHMSTIGKNENLLNTLKYVEVMCDNPAHVRCPAICYNKNDLQVYCNKCNNKRFSAFTNPYPFIDQLNKKLLEIPSTECTEFMKSYIKEYFIIPLVVKLRLYRTLKMKKDNIQVLRFSKHLPSNAACSYQ